jgi:uncharacterized spore protein YtfJ
MRQDEEEQMASPTTTNTSGSSMSGQSMSSQMAQTNPESPSFLERLANQMGIRTGATSIVGTPIEREGVTVVPITRATWGFGGGGGRGGEGANAGEGSGGGGGANVRPVGYIELRNGESIFRPVYDPNTVLRIAATVATGLALAMTLRMLARVLRGN